jgi:hypothetical protein
MVGVFPRRPSRLAVLVAALLACTCSAGDPPAARHFAATLPAFTLADPRGAQHGRDALLADDGGLLIIVTAPRMSQGDEQTAWNDAITAAAPAHARWLLLEDLSQSSFPGTALGRMKDEFDPAVQPLLLIDRDGALRTALGVAEDATVILVYDRHGALVSSETAEASPARAQRLWAAFTRAAAR